ncbi:MAG: HD domain-containing protein, partial [Deltaproteobacteria bacterium]|nr:HD domain-containing protein [Deltaproteobacteria bacterium]
MTRTLVPIYEELTAEAEDLYQKISAGALSDFQLIQSFSEKLLEAVRAEGAGLFELACHPFSDKFLARHVIHAALLSVMLGQSLKLKAEKLLGLAQTAILFDVGMTTLSGNEIAQIRQHPEAGAKLLEALSGLPGDVSQAVAQHHERFDGSGYPKGLKEDHIHLFARIIGLADTFCNLIHVTPGQRRLSLYEA